MTNLLRDQLPAVLAGAYRLEREIGRGGMATVFLAEDVKHRRQVAVKVLHAELAAAVGGERFLREIEVTARLHHPHILSLHDSGEAAAGDAGGPSLLYYVMPYVEGESLRERLTRERQLPVDEAVRIACDVASALDYAHRHGVIHRDIKPENVLLHEGRAIVADFGVARAVQRAASAHTLTGTGITVGTPQYMSPEQAAGDRDIDARSDVFSLGCVLYEMLAGVPPFAAATAQGVIAKVITEMPRPVTAERRAVPASVGMAVMRALEKVPADRFATAAQLAAALAPSTVSAVAHNDAPEPSPRQPLRASAGRRGAAWAFAAAGIAAITFGVAWRGGAVRQASDPPRPRVRFTLELPAEAALNVGTGSSMALSPDGSMIVYVGGAQRQLHVRRLDELTPRPLAGTEQAANPQFSRDGRWVAYFIPGRGELRRVPTDGGPTMFIATGVARFAWGADSTLIFTRSELGGQAFIGGLWRVSASGGTPERITTPDSALGGAHGSPSVLPDGKTVLFTGVSAKNALTLGAVRLDERKTIPLGIDGGNALFVSGGYLVFARPDGVVSAVRFDPERLRVIGEPVRMLDGVATKGGGAAEVALSANGTLVYIPGTFGAHLAAVDDTGGAQVLIPTVQTYASPRVSPDGRRVAVAFGHPPYSSDIAVYDVPSGTFTRLTTDGRSSGPEWTPDGRRVAWTTFARVPTPGASAGNKGIWWQPWDRSAPPELLLPGAHRVRFTPRGDQVVAGFDAPSGTEVRLVSIPARAGDPGRVLLPAVFEDRWYRVSPDGRWLAFVSDETGSREVYVQPLPGPGGRIQISSGGGTQPVWSPDGRQLYYLGRQFLLLATLATAPEITVLRRDTVMSSTGWRSAYDVTPTGARVVVARATGTIGATVVVLGWADEVRERLEAAASSDARAPTSRLP